MSKHLTATIVSVIGALELVLQTCGVKLPNVDANDVANAVATLVTVGGAIYAAFVHKKAVQALQTPTTQPSVATK